MQIGAVFPQFEGAVDVGEITTFAVGVRLFTEHHCKGGTSGYLRNKVRSIMKIAALAIKPWGGRLFGRLCQWEVRIRELRRVH